MAEVTCQRCYRRRMDAWRRTRESNGLTAQEWPAPKAPVFEDAVALARHTQKEH